MTQTLSEIKKQYIVVSTLRRDGKDILYCRGKSDASYKFFTPLADDQYTDVDQQTYDKLRRLFPSGLPTEYFASTTGGDETDEDIEKAVEKTRRIILRCLDERFQGYPESVKKECEANRKTLKIVAALGKGGFGQGAGYLPMDHEVNIYTFDKNLFQMAYLVLHETYHGITRDRDNPGTSGIIKIIGLQAKNSTNESINIIGVGLNEAITDYLAVKDITNFLEKQDYISPSARQFLAQKSYSAYDIIANVFINVFDKVDIKRALNYYFTNDLDGLLGYMQQQYHYKDHDTILSWIYKMDAFVNFLNNQNEQAEFSDYSTLIQGLYLDTFQMIVHKYIAEGKDVAEIPFEKVFTDERLPVEGAEKAAFVDALKYVYENYAKNKIDLVTKHNLTQDALKHVTFLELASNRKPFYLPENEFDAEFLLRAFSSSIHIFDGKTNSPTEESIAKKQVAFEFTFSEKANCFTTHKQKIRIISELIRNENQIPFRFMQYFAASDVAEALQGDKTLATIVAKQDFPVFMSCMPVLGDKILSMKDVKLEIAKSCLYLKAQNKDYKNVLEYYKFSFSSKQLADKNLAEILKILEKYDEYVKQEQPNEPETPNGGESADIK